MTGVVEQPPSAALMKRPTLVRMMEKAQRQRDIVRDLKWGAREGFIRTGLMLVPAILVFMLGGKVSTIRFAEMLALYLVFGTTAGTALGVVRPWLSRKSVATVSGCIIGSLAVLAVVCFPSSDHPFPGKQIAIVSAVFGAMLGAPLGRFTWMRDKQRRARRVL